MFYYWTEEKLFITPQPQSNSFKLLKRFILYQAFRTPKSGKELTQSPKQSLKKVLRELQPETWEKIKDSTISHQNPTLLSLANSIGRENLLNFLDCRFMVNLSELPFISSDAPVIFYNQLMEAADNYIGATGLVAKELQIFYPIHPRLIICLYDAQVYDLGNGCANCCAIESIEEIHQLNALQFINSDSQLFFDDLKSQEYIIELCKEYDNHRKKTRHINTFINTNSKKLFFTGTEDAHINLNLKSFRFLVNPLDYMNDIVPLRDISLSR